MSDDASTEAQDRIACATYTHARRHPMVLGQIGGWTPPFQLTPAQLVVLITSIVVESQTWRWWGAYMPPVLGVAIAAGLPCGATWAVRRGRVEGRSLGRTALGWLVLYTQGSAGRVGGRPNRPERPRLLTPVRTFVAAGDDDP